MASTEPQEEEKNSVPGSEEQQEDQTLSERQLRGLPWVLVVFSILTSTFLFGLDNTIVAVVQPAIVDQFGSVDRIAWLSVAFLVSAASTTLFWFVLPHSNLFEADASDRGQMYGQCNTKWLYISCILIFEIGSAICGAAPSMTALIVGRAICGLGGTGMYTGVL